MTATASIVIPAHDEGALIAFTLRGVLADALPGEFEIVVAANGCTDDTVAQASSVPGVTVVETAIASKIAGLNLGDKAATAFPRIYLDADVAVSAATLRSLAAALRARTDPTVAAPRLRVDGSRSTLPVRQYLRIWEQSDYRLTGHIGSGVYAVNREGRARWDEFPDVIADDRFVQQLFLPEERITVDGEFTVRAPATMRAHLRRAARIAAGNRQLPATVQNASVEPAAVRYRRLLGRVARKPALWGALPFYLYGFGVPLAQARRMDDAGSRVDWSRDTSLREEARR